MMNLNNWLFSDKQTNFLKKTFKNSVFIQKWQMIVYTISNIHDQNHNQQIF